MAKDLKKKGRKLTGHDQTSKLSASLHIEIMQFVFVSPSRRHFLAIFSEKT